MTKEIISKFKEKPKTKIAWWTMWLGLGALLESFVLYPLNSIIFQIFFINIIKKLASNDIALFNSAFGISVGMVIALVLSTSAIILGIISFNKGERSWVLWIGFVLAILTAIISALLLWYSSFWLSYLSQKGIFQPGENNTINIFAPDDF